MARYVTRVRTSMAADAAFAYMADLRNFAEWDPGVPEVAQVRGDGGGPGAVFDVTVRGVGRDLVLRYETTEHEPPDRLRVVARSRLLTSVDVVAVEADGDGSVVTYDATLTLNGLLGLADPLLRLAFGRIGDRAAVGLRRRLDGVEVGVEVTRP